MKKILSIIAVISFAACSPYNVSMRPTFEGYEDLYGKACPNPNYVATMGLNATKNLEGSHDQKSVTIYKILDEAQKKYGPDVTIQNIRWDMQGNTKIAVIFDVIRCK